MPTNFKKNILLTGAGFTANFGGVLAREMWSKILNNKKIDGIPEAKKLLMKNFDFEAVSSDFLNNSQVPVDQKTLFQEIVLESYESMDRTIKHFCTHGFNEYGVSWSNVARFLALFDGTTAEKGAHFTLNQDVLLERAVQRHPLGLPAANANYRAYWDSITQGSLDTRATIQLPNDAELQSYMDSHFSSEGQFYYIKLHGSQGWASATGGNQMVIGKNKFADIQREPLLKWYFTLLEDALYREDVNLFVVGYSFRDSHINDILLKAVQEHHLKIYVISPEDPESLKNRLEGRPDQPGIAWEVLPTLKIWEAVRGYFPHSLREIFPADNDDGTEMYKDIEKIIKANS